MADIRSFFGGGRASGGTPAAKKDSSSGNGAKAAPAKAAAKPSAATRTAATDKSSDSKSTEKASPAKRSSTTTAAPVKSTAASSPVVIDSDSDDDFTVKRKKKRKTIIEDDDDVTPVKTATPVKKKESPKKTRPAAEADEAEIEKPPVLPIASPAQVRASPRKAAATGAGNSAAPASAPVPAPAPAARAQINMNANDFFGSFAHQPKEKQKELIEANKAQQQQIRGSKTTVKEEVDEDDVQVTGSAPAKRKADTQASDAALAQRLHEEELSKLASPAKKQKAEPAATTAVKVEKSPAKKATPTKEAPSDKKKATTTKEAASPAKKKTTGSASKKSDSDDEGAPKKKFDYGKYTAYKAAANAPPMLGTKAVPTGAPNCLEGLNFVISGILDSLPRDDAKALIEQYGGKVTGSISGKTTHLLAGNDAGASKLDKAKEKGLTVVDEDGLFEMIKTRPGKGGAAAGSASKPAVAPSKPAAPAPKPLPPLPKPAPSTADALWVDKWKPSNMEQIIGNKALVTRLKDWLSKWQQTYLNPNHELAKDEKMQRAALLSGPPGTGKSTCAGVVARACGYEVVEYNASDVRSKKNLDEEVGELIGTHGLTEFFSSARNVKHVAKKTVLIMDEVDGMDGNADRGGVAQLIQLIKKTKTPIICICNDMSSPKMKSLKNYCMQMSWKRADARTLAPRIQQLAHAEGLKMDMETAEKLVEGTRGDIRQIINFLQMYRKTATTLSSNQANDKMKGSAQKDFDMGPFDVVPDFFKPYPKLNREVMDDLSNKAFLDMSLIPMFIYENYIYGRGRTIAGSQANLIGVQHMESIAAAADLVADADLLSRRIGAEQDYSLSPEMALLSTVAVGYHAGVVHNRPAFPMLLGQISHINKHIRLSRELKHAMSLDISCSQEELATMYLPLLRTELLAPLVQEGADGVAPVIELLDTFGLTKEDWDNLMEITTFKTFNQAMKADLPTAVKSAFTRKYNGSSHTLKVARVSTNLVTGGRGGGGGSSASAYDEESAVEESAAAGGEEEAGGSEAEDGEDDEGGEEGEGGGKKKKDADAMVKQIQPKGGRGAKAAGAAAPAGAKRGGRGGGAAGGSSRASGGAAKKKATKSKKSRDDDFIDDSDDDL